MGASDRPRAGRGSGRGIDRGARGRAGEARQHVGPRGPRGRGQGGLSQGAHVRCRNRWPALPRVRRRAAGSGDRPVRDRRRGWARAVDLLRPALPRALPHPRRGRCTCDRAAGGVHTVHDPGPLGSPRPRPCDREPGVHDRRQPGGTTPGGPAFRRAFDDRRPLGGRAGPGRRPRGPHRRQSRPGAPGGDPGAAAGARKPPAVGLPLAARGGRVNASRSSVPRAKAALDKRPVILDAAAGGFARQGFHACRVSDIAAEAGVAYGLVYHYFASKDEVLDTLFLERWNVMLEMIREVDVEPIPVREKLEAIVSFIVDSYRHDPDLMKVIIVEVTRAANSFGQTHLGQIREAYELIEAIVAKAQAEGTFKAEIEAQFAAMA